MLLRIVLAAVIAFVLALASVAVFATSGASGATDISPEEQLWFEPERYITRAEATTLLWRALGAPQATTPSNFVDVDSNRYYAPAIDWCFEQSICEGTTVDPTQP